MTVSDILREKGSNVITIRPEATLLEAVQSLMGHGIGALLVTNEEEHIKGIVTERDVLRFSLSRYDKLNQVPVSEVMTKELVICVPEDSLDRVMHVMTEKRIRHLPILSEWKLVGIISIGDVVKAKARSQEYEIRYLKDYITGKYPG